MASTFPAELLQVEDVRDGLVVRLQASSVGPSSVRELPGELFDLAFHRGGPHLYLDFAEVETLDADMLTRLVMLDWKLQSVGDRLILLNLPAPDHRAPRASRLIDHMHVSATGLPHP